jgi:hypothetical protein
MQMHTLLSKHEEAFTSLPLRDIKVLLFYPPKQRNSLG